MTIDRRNKNYSLDICVRRGADEGSHREFDAANVRNKLACHTPSGLSNTTMT